MCLSSCMGRKTPASCRSCSRRVLVSVGDFSVSWCSICGDFLEINSENSLIQVNQWSIFMMGNILDHSSVHHHHLCFWMIHQWNRCNCDKSLQTPVCVLTCLEVKLNLESCLAMLFHASCTWTVTCSPRWRQTAWPPTSWTTLARTWQDQDLQATRYVLLREASKKKN